VFRFPNLLRRRPGPEDFVIEKKLKATTHREGPMGTMIRTSRFVEHKWCMIMSVDNAWANNCAALNQNNSCTIYIFFFLTVETDPRVAIAVGSDPLLLGSLHACPVRVGIQWPTASCSSSHQIEKVLYGGGDRCVGLTPTGVQRPENRSLVARLIPRPDRGRQPTHGCGPPSRCAY
jgi:hypothetical protein